jgi:hypothetical protein
MRNETNRLTPAQLARLRKWLDELMSPAAEESKSQHDIAARLHVSQALISNLLRGANTTRGTALQMLEHGGGDADAVLGDGASVADTKYRERDAMPARGHALDALSLIYEEDFCETILSMTPPPGSDTWTTDLWVDHIVSLRKLWQSGHLRPKRLRSRSGE